MAETKEQAEIKQQVVIRLDRDLVKRIDHIAVEWDDFRGAAIERLLSIAVEYVENQGELQLPAR